MVKADSKKVNYWLIDDDAVDIMAIQRAFKKSEIVSPLYTAGNGIEALELLQSSPNLNLASRNIILLDLDMPKMGGIEFLERLRQIPALKTLPVIVLTTSSHERDRTAAYRLGVLGYMIKPVNFSRLIDLVETVDLYLSYCLFPVANSAKQPAFVR